MRMAVQAVRAATMFKIRREQKEAFDAAFGPGQAVAPCATCLVVRIAEIKGLFKPGHDDRVNPPPGTTKGAGYQYGYASEDDGGRIFINRETNGTDRKGTGRWVRDIQGIEITVAVDPMSVPIPPGTMIEWSFEDPDDPTNEDPIVHPDAGRLLDPNDYLTDYEGGWKKGPVPNDNDPRGLAETKFEELEPRFPLSGGNQTPVDPLTRVSKVRFTVSHFAGDNYRVKARVLAGPPITSTVPAQTGIMTVWNRIQIEYVRMESARELPVTEVAPHFALACAQVDISERRVASPYWDEPVMGTNEKDADHEVKAFANNEHGEFTHAGEGGWFFVGAANRYVPVSPRKLIWEGQATAHGDHLRLPRNAFLKKNPTAVVIFNPHRTAGLPKPWPHDRNLYTAFVCTDTRRRDPWTSVYLVPADYHYVDDPDNTFLWADLSDYGFAEGAKLDVQFLAAGGVVLGTNTGEIVDDKNHTWFAGRVVVFTTDNKPADDLSTLVHELGHAFDTAHKCGNWDFARKADRTSCAMNYDHDFILDDAPLRAPIPWTQNRTSADLCGPHLRRLRDVRRQDNIALKWGKP